MPSSFHTAAIVEHLKGEDEKKNLFNQNSVAQNYFSS